jgi:hypothetical protein
MQNMPFSKCSYFGDVSKKKIITALFCRFFIRFLIEISRFRKIESQLYQNAPSLVISLQKIAEFFAI